MAISPPSERFAFVFLEIFEREGGIQSYVKDVFRAYGQLESKPDADVFLLRDRQGDTNPFEGSSLTFHYFKTPIASLGRIRFAAAFLLYLIRHRPRRVFCGHIRLARLTHLFCSWLSIPYTVMTHGKEVWERLPEGDRHAMLNADRIWTVSRYTQHRFCRANEIPLEQVDRLPCSVDGDYFTPGPPSPDLRATYELDRATVLLTVARLWPKDRYKGVDVTIQALPQILKVHPTVKYLVIGRGDDQPRLAQLAEDLGVADRVVFAGFVPDDALRDHYRLADAYVMPSQEGFGIVYLEALACGVPVISGDDDGSADPLQDGRVGWRVPHRRPEAIAQACIELLNGTDPRCDAVWLRRETLAKFSRQAFAARLAELLETALSQDC